jgi:hypothetical protein
VARSKIFVPANADPGASSVVSLLAALPLFALGTVVVGLWAASEEGSIAVALWLVAVVSAGITTFFVIGTFINRSALVAALRKRRGPE